MDKKEETRKNFLLKNIFFTVIYYNICGYPPTTFEIWKYLISYEAVLFSRGKKNLREKIIEKCSLEEVDDALDFLEKEKKLFFLDGFWILKGFEKIPRERIKRQKISVEKLKKIKKWAWLFQFIPYGRGLFVGGTLSMKKADVLSDWDVFVITKKNRIWAGRFFVTLFFHFFGKRRYGKKTKDRFCLNHFLAEDGLILEERSEYSANEIVFAIPFFGREVFGRFAQLNEFLVNKFKPNYRADISNDYFFIKECKIARQIRSGFEFLMEKFFLGDLLNKISRKIMIWKIKHNPKTNMKGADIRYSDKALIFLPEPKRDVVFQKAEQVFQEFFGDRTK